MYDLLAVSSGCTVPESSSIEPFHPGEEQGDLLALAFEGSAGGDDAFGEMSWGVRPGRGRTQVRRRPRKRPAASTARLAARLVYEAAASARLRWFIPAGGAEPATRLVLVLAPGTLQAGTPSDPGR